MNLIHKILGMSLVIFASCAPDARIPKIFGGPDAIATMNAPDKVEAWRTIAPHKLEEEKMGGKKVTQTKGKLADYLIIKGPVEVDAQTGAEIAAILQRNQYKWKPPYVDCLPNPGFAVQYTQGTNSTQIFFCFECGILETYFNGNKSSKMEFSHDGLRALLTKVSP